MTKFEEELNKKMDLKEVPMYFTQSGCSMTRKTYIETNWIFDNYKNWHSDEEFQELKEEYSNQAESILLMLEEIKTLKSQLQQQAQPVVPECVGLGISEDIHLNTVVADVLTTVITSDDKDLKEYGLWIKENLVTYVIARTLGYTVEKPQLFYLKHIDMSKQLRYCDCYLVKEGDGALWHDDTINKNEKPGAGYKNSCYTFTQQEIVSMQTGSYEQIEVAE